MSLLQRTEEGRVIIPIFPDLIAKINEAQKEVDFINSEVIPALRESGFAPSMGLNCKLILSAIDNREFLPSIPKKNLRYSKYIAFNGKSCYFKKEDFQFAYDLTTEGRERIAVLKEFEELPDELKRTAIFQR